MALEMIIPYTSSDDFPEVTETPIVE